MVNYMNITLDIIMMITILPIILILYFYEYPRNWTKRKYIYGICNRDEYKQDRLKNEIDKISNKYNRQAKYILIALIILTIILVLIPYNMVKFMVFSYLALIAFFVIYIPFVIANKELKNFKKIHNIGDTKLNYTDLTNVGQIHALSIKKLLIPNIVGLAIILISLLCDLGFIHIP